MQKIQCAVFATPVEQDNGLIRLSGQRSREGGVTIHSSNDRNYAALKHAVVRTGADLGGGCRGCAPSHR